MGVSGALFFIILFVLAGIVGSRLQKIYNARGK
jgi:hypothetical protein